MLGDRVAMVPRAGAWGRRLDEVHRGGQVVDYRMSVLPRNK